MSTYFGRVRTIFSQALNVVFFGGDEDESLSARSYREKESSPFWAKSYQILNKVFFWDDNHCYKEFLEDYNKAEALVRKYDKA